MFLDPVDNDDYHTKFVKGAGFDIGVSRFFHVIFTRDILQWDSCLTYISSLALVLLLPPIRCSLLKLMKQL